MSQAISIDHDGEFTIEGRRYQIPHEFSSREIYSYRRLLEPLPDIPGGTSLTGEQRRRQRAYFLRRAAACVIPGLDTSTLETLPYQSLERLHTWLTRHHPELSESARPAAG